MHLAVAICGLLALLLIGALGACAPCRFDASVPRCYWSF
jgi:hypothetical protein